MVLHQSPVLSQEHQSLGCQEFLRAHELSQSPADYIVYSCKIEDRNTMTVRDSKPNHS